MTNINAYKPYRAMHVAHHRRQPEMQNVFLGVAFEIERPVQVVFKSLWNVLTSPVESTKYSMGNNH
jgi:hypothetical protein